MSEQQTIEDVAPETGGFAMIEEHVSQLEEVAGDPERALPLYQQLSAALDAALQGSDELPGKPIHLSGTGDEFTAKA